MILPIKTSESGQFCFLLQKPPNVRFRDMFLHLAGNYTICHRPCESGTLRKIQTGNGNSQRHLAFSQASRSHDGIEFEPFENLGCVAMSPISFARTKPPDGGSKDKYPHVHRSDDCSLNRPCD